MKTVILKRGKESSLLRRHQWVFSGAIFKTSAEVDNGELVSVESEKGDFLGIGHYHAGSIAVRMLTFTKERVDQEFWNARLAAALQLRSHQGLPSKHTNCFRLVHGEGDGLPGCVIDIYNDCAVIQSHSTGMSLSAKPIAKALQSLTSLRLKTIYHQDLTTKTSNFLAGKEAGTEVLENGLKFNVNWVDGQKTGFFLDQRDNRALVGALAAGRKVLNTFCYTGGFSVYAQANKAASVTSVDVSQPAIDMTELNCKLNGQVKNHSSICTDAFKHLEHAQGFDLIILDPPAFAKSIKARHRAVQGYKRLNEIALKNIEKGGLLFTFSCSQVVDPQLFEKTVLSSAINANREVRVLKRLGHQGDHPVSIFHPEAEYLKGLLLYVS